MAELKKPVAPPAAYKQGPFRGYFSSAVPPTATGKARITSSDLRHVTIVFVVAIIVRTYRLYWPANVVFDETHLGGFVKNYYDGEFFVDVHPPLGKLMFYLIALIFRWDGQFSFDKIGDAYDANVPYVAMRFYSAVCGVATAGSVFFALRASGCRSKIATLGSLVVVFETSLAAQSRLIMLDSSLVAFTTMAVASFQRFRVAQPFTRKWYKTLVSTGVSLGLAVSTKLTGLFTVTWVVLWSAASVWALLGDLAVSKKRVLAHAAARFFAFVAIPATIYCGVFALHFMALPYNGPGSGQVSPQFKASLVDSHKLRDTPVDVSYGSTVTLKHHRLATYLHSHNYTYQTGSREQQVSMYGFEPDAQNEWVLETAGVNFDGKFDTKFRPIYDGDTVKLFHKATRTYLRANDVRPPNHEHDYSNEVSCKGSRDDTADINYEWRVSIVGRKPHAETELPLRKLRATESVFKLVHRGTHCTLLGHETKLPEWGHFQNQVVCVNNPTVANTLWYIEGNSHPVLDTDPETYPRVKLPELSFFWKMAEYHQAMWRTNKALTQKHVAASLPASWPFAIRGINYYSSSQSQNQDRSQNHGGNPGLGSGSHIYLLGNVVVYYGGLAALFVFGLKYVWYVFQSMNPFVPHFVSPDAAVYYTASLHYASGWALHYIPFWFMHRQLFAHHYLTSVVFLVLTIAQLVECQASSKSRSWAAFWQRGFEAYLCGVIYVFVKLYPVVYGVAWSIPKCQAAKWMSGWDFDCMAYGY